MMRSRQLGVGLAATLAVACIVRAQAPDPTSTEIWEPVPQVVEPGNGTAPPSDAIVLFDGASASAWRHRDGRPAEWTLEGGAMTVASGSGDIETREAFGDSQLHIEWRTPSLIEGTGQGRGNSGIFLQRRYEVQVLDSYGNDTYVNGQAASIYKQRIPLVNASRKPGEWQTYDIVFRAPRFDAAGTLVAPAIITVIHNGVLVQNNVEIKGPTVFIGEPAYDAHAPEEPLSLQDHGNRVSYRNIWIRRL